MIGCEGCPRYTPKSEYSTGDIIKTLEDTCEDMAIQRYAVIPMSKVDLRIAQAEHDKRYAEYKYWLVVDLELLDESHIVSVFACDLHGVGDLEPVQEEGINENCNRYIYEDIVSHLQHNYFSVFKDLTGGV